MKCKESSLIYFGAVAFVACVFLFLAVFLFRFLKGWKDHGTRAATHSHGFYVRQAAAFCVCELRNVLLIAALTETRRVSHSRSVRVLLFFAMTSQLFVWLCCFSIWVTRLQLAFANTVYEVSSRLLRVYRVSAVFVAVSLFTSSTVHFATTNKPLEQVLLHVVTALSFVAMFTLQTHLCSNFVSRLIQLVAATTKGRLQRSQSERMTSTTARIPRIGDSPKNGVEIAETVECVEMADETRSTSRVQSRYNVPKLMYALSETLRSSSRVSDFEQSERELLRVATKQSVVIASAILCELFAMAGFLVLSESGPNSLCVTPLNLCAFIAVVAGVNGVVFSVYLSFIHSHAEYNALCSKCDNCCGKLAAHFVDSYSEEPSPKQIQCSKPI